MLGVSFSSKLDWGSYKISMAKTASRKLGALTRSMKFLSPEVALYLFKFIIRPCVESVTMAGAPSSYLELFDNLQKRICRTVGFSLAASLDVLAHCQNAASLSLVGITLVYVNLRWLDWFHFLILEGDLLVILIDCINFLSPCLDVIRMSMSTASFTTQLDSEIICL